MMLRSHSRAGRSEVISAEIQYEKPDCAPRPEPEIARPDGEDVSLPNLVVLGPTVQAYIRGFVGK